MKCPNDGTTLQMTERSGVEIDYCPECRGVWLDRGELDKIIDKSVGPASAPAQHHSATHQQHPAYDPHYHKKHRKESFLGELFDF